MGFGKIVLVSAVATGAAIFYACGSDDSDSSTPTTTAGTCSGTHFDSSLFRSLTSAQQVSCTFSDGTATTCCELTFAANQVDDDGPFCPTTSTTDATQGGLGNYDGTTGPGLQSMVKTLWDNMETDGYDILDGTSVRVQTDVPGGGLHLQPGGGGGGGQAYCLQPSADDTLTVTYTIPLTPTAASSNDTISSVEDVGVSLDGVPFKGAPPSVTGNNGMIPSLDWCGGHHDPSGYYHWHFIPESIDPILDGEGITVDCDHITQDNDALFGFAKDGYPIYAMYDEGETTAPTDLDECGGHTGTTSQFGSIYHYHADASADENEPVNIPTCLKGKSVTNPSTVN